jgi:hypothetical protein
MLTLLMNSGGKRTWRRTDTTTDLSLDQLSLNGGTQSTLVSAKGNSGAVVFTKFSSSQLFANSSSSCSAESISTASTATTSVASQPVVYKSFSGGGSSFADSVAVIGPTVAEEAMNEEKAVDTESTSSCTVSSDGGFMFSTGM